MIDVKILATGSDGNCVWLGNESAAVLVDIGLPKSKVEKILLGAGVDPSKIDAVFLTHEHQDHAKGLAFADKFKIPVYASAGTLEKLERSDTGKAMIAGGWIGFDAMNKTCLRIRSFPVSHDAKEPFGFTIQDHDSKVSVLMDTGIVTAEMIEAMRHSDIYVFECNHDIEMLQTGDYDDFLKQRVGSDVGHLSNTAAAEALSQLIRGRGERIYLTHMSSNNNNPELASRAVRLALHQKGFVKGKHYHLEAV